VDFVPGNSNKLQKLGLEGKNQFSPQCVHIIKFRYVENVKNKGCVHTWAHNPGYTIVK
jgi:hypothetical protein